MLIKIKNIIKNFYYIFMTYNIIIFEKIKNILENSYFSYKNINGYYVEKGIFTKQDILNMKEEENIKKEALFLLIKLIKASKRKSLDELYIGPMGFNTNVIRIKKRKGGYKNRNLYLLFIEYLIEDSVDNWSWYNNLLWSLYQYNI